MKLAATDFDGTFCPIHEPVPQSNIDAVKRWQAAGNKFGICTGRGLSLIDFELQKYPDLQPDYLVCNNGAVIVDKKKEILTSLTFPCEMLQGLLAMPLIHETNNPMRILTETDMYLLDIPTAMEFGLNIPMEKVTFAKAREMPKVVQVSMRCATVEEAQETTAKVRAKYPEIIGNINRNYVDLNLKEANKRDGLRRLLKVTKWQPEEIFFIGDDQNDLPAVEYFQGYTVETAQPFMKEAAKAVYPSVGDMLLQNI
ncbi:HAD-IIB family hydrolase [Mitsuokella sp.]|uniref:HAD-IIB family hydrolase n=1 Tax=Mitsuokella sp. TaxID=2049034 RepID=UPI003D7D145E